MITLTVMLAAIMTVLDSTIANVALPHMAGSMSASADQINWVLTSYIIATAIMTPVTGWLAGRLGVKRMFVIAITGFTVASALCGAAQNLAQIVIFRALQGAFGAGMMPLSQTVMLDSYPLRERGQAMAIWGMGVTVGPILGPVIGGWLTDDFSWRWVFYINLPIGGLCVAGVLAFLPHNQPAHKRPLEWLGFLLLAVGLAAFQLMLDRGQQNDWFGSRETVAEAVIAACALWMFVTHTLTRQPSFLPVAMLGDRNFVTATLINLMLGVLVFPVMAILPPMLETLLGYPVLTTGIVLAPRGIGSIFSMFVVGRIINRVDPRALIISGLGVFALSFWSMSHFALNMDWRAIATTGFIQGLGTGMVFTPVTVLAFGTLRPTLRADATGFFALLRSVGNSAGISLLQAVYTRLVQTVHSQLVGRLSPANPLIRAPEMGGPFSMASGSGMMAMNEEATRQASMVAYVDLYHLLYLTALAIMPLILFLRPIAAAPTGAPIAADH
jgi:DHA2 family multidrug resistance protein